MTAQSLGGLSKSIAARRPTQSLRLHLARPALTTALTAALIAVLALPSAARADDPGSRCVDPGPAAIHGPVAPERDLEAPAPDHHPLPGVAADTIYELRLHDGSTFLGRVVAETADSLTFVTTGGLRLELDRAQVRWLRPVTGRVVDGELWPHDPNRTRLLLVSPTGRALRQGEAYISAFWVVVPFVGYGLTDNFTIAGGTPLLPDIIGRVFYLAPKLRVLDTHAADVSVGALAFFASEAIDEGSIGVAYGVGTFGDPDRSITAGIGWGWAFGRGDPWVSDDPVVLVGGEYRVSRRVKLLTENLFLPAEGEGLLTGGVRFMAESLAVDFGVAAPIGHSGWLPVLNFVYTFGRSP